MQDYGQIEIGDFTFWPPDKDGEIEIEFNDEVPYGGSRGVCFIHIDKLRPWVAPLETKESQTTDTQHTHHSICNLSNCIVGDFRGESGCCNYGLHCDYCKQHNT